MARDITITFDDGSSHTYKGAPDTITPEIVQKRAEAQFGKSVTNIDGGMKSEPPPDEGFLTKIRKGAESFIEPAATIASGAVAMPIAGFAGMAGDIYAGLTGGPRIGEEVASDVQKALTYQPRSQGAQINLESFGQAFQASKLPVAPQITGGLTSAAMNRLAGPAARQAGNIAREEALSAAQALPDVGGKLQSGAQKLMLNALKPTIKQQASGSAEIAARQLLERDLSPNAKGVMAINARIAELQGEIASTIGGSKSVISKQAVLDRLISVRDRFMKTANPESDVAAINAAAAGFAEHPLIPGETLPVQLAQDIKQGTYSELRKKYGELGSAQTESQKALARGLKEEIASVEPAVIPLNAEESTLLKTLDVVERRQFLEMNKDPVPLTGALRNPAAWAAITADKSSAFKSLLARLMYKTGKAIKGDAPTVAVPPAPTSTAVTPFVQRGEYQQAGTGSPNWVPGRAAGIDPDVQPAMVRTPGLLGFTPNAEMNRPRGFPNANMWAEMAAQEAEAATPRRPASGGMLYDLDPITGRLRAADEGLRGATPATVESTGNNLSSAVQKISSGQKFAMSSEERIAWDRSKVDLVKAAPELRGLTDDAIAAKVFERRWVDNRIQELKSEYAAWAKNAGQKYRESINERANTPPVLSAAERAARKQINSEASRRMQLEIEIRKADMKAKIDSLEVMSDTLASQRAGTRIYVGQGPKTRAANRGMMSGADQ